MDLTGIGCDDERWMEPAQDRVQLWVLVLRVLSRLLTLCKRGLLYQLLLIA
jgi:hypothetical protein